MSKDVKKGSGSAGSSGSQGGIPDGLLVGAIAFLIGITLLVWTATGLSALFSHGTWPGTVTFARTPVAMHHLIREPHDIAGAWPDTAAGSLSGYGLFWGLFIGQLLILLVLSIFVLGTVARWRAGRRARAAGMATATEKSAPAPAQEPAVATPREVPYPRREAQQPAPKAPVPEVAVPETPVQPEPSVPVEGVQGVQAMDAVRPSGLVFAGLDDRRPTAAQTVRDAEGPTVVVTSDPALWEETKDGRAKLGPVLLYDPLHLCDTPARLHWPPIAGCEDKATAASRATALLAPVRPTARMDQAVADVAETLLRSYLHAAAIDGRTIRHVHRWTQGSQVQDAVRALRTHTKASPGAAGELESALTSYPERRDMAHELTGRALSSLFTVNVREACTPNRNDALVLDSFIDEGGTLYVVGEPVEDPRTDPGAMPLLTALVSNVVERGRRVAERSPAGRLDPPMTLVLDDVAAVAPLPQLPELLATGADRGLPTLALLRSREQLRARWPGHQLPV